MDEAAFLRSFQNLAVAVRTILRGANLTPREELFLRSGVLVGLRLARDLLPPAQRGPVVEYLGHMEAVMRREYERLGLAPLPDPATGREAAA